MVVEILLEVGGFDMKRGVDIDTQLCDIGEGVPCKVDGIATVQESSISMSTVYLIK